MARPKTPRLKADVTGYSTKHPERFRPKPNATVVDRPVGEPYDWLKPEAHEAWQELADNLPWLNYSHRAIVGLTAYLAGRLRLGTLPDSGANLLRQCLGSLGATPADFAKVGWAPPVDDDDDPGGEFFR
ncbi:MAG: hypothetical protein JNK47_16800 [Mesorhizobium sp.]|nr:hypothetical protein [Mesorhizobium sp.]MBL8578884.1 hypothetical protein [Mesorhizobium sp.]